MLKYLFLPHTRQWFSSFFYNCDILGIDCLLAQHVAHLFIRDPVSLFSEKIHQDDSTDSDHFEVGYYSTD